MKDFLSVGIFGLGNVGTGVVELFARNREIIARRVGREIRVVKAVVSDPDKDRGIDLSDIEVGTRAEAILDDPNVDIVVELIGGLDPAQEYVIEALRRGKAVVTANKALLAERSRAVFQSAYEADGYLGFEAGVGGGIPIIRSVRDGFSGDEIEEIAGIMNGTANYILSRMTEAGAKFADALKDAQEKGYAEADPTFDIEGHDTAHKLVILMNLAFDGLFDFNQVYTEGITGIEPVDIKVARELGYKIKLLGKAKRTAKGVEGRAHPSLVAEGRMLASVEGAFNAIHVKGNFVGPSMLYGQGAGSRPTASAVAGDIVDAARVLASGQKPSVYPLSSISVPEPRQVGPVSEIISEYYLRFRVLDKLGVLAEISGILGKNDIGIRSVIQKTEANESDTTAMLIMVTHKAKEKNLKIALQSIDELCFVKEKTRLIRIEP